MRGRIEASSGSIGEFNIATVGSGDVKVGYLFGGNTSGTAVILTDTQTVMRTATRRTTIQAEASSFGLNTNTLNFPQDGITITGGLTNAISTLGVLRLRASTASTGGIFVRGRNLSSDTLLRNPNGTGGFDAATEVSSRVVKKDIQDLDTNTVASFMETIDIKHFKYKQDNSAGISLIIEDEQADNIPYQDALFAKIQGQILFDT